MKYVVSIALLLCLLDMPYGYYQLVRLVAAVYFGYELMTNEDDRYKFVLIILMILFQPFFKISLGRTMWNIVDVIVAVWLLFFYTANDES